MSLKNPSKPQDLPSEKLTSLYLQQNNLYLSGYPHPDLIKGYQEIDYLDYFKEQLESETAHLRLIECQELSHNNKRQYIGQIAVIVLSFACLLGGFYGIYKNYEYAFIISLGVLTAPILSILSNIIKPFAEAYIAKLHYQLVQQEESS